MSSWPFRPEARGQFVFVGRKGAEMKRNQACGGHNNRLMIADWSDSVDWANCPRTDSNQITAGLKVEGHLPVSPASSAFNVSSLSRSASCFCLLWSSSLICRSSATCWSSLSWAWRQNRQRHKQSSTWEIFQLLASLLFLFTIHQ